MKRILIVDDDIAVRRGLGLMLGRGGYEVSAVDSEEEALSAVRANKFDLVLSDMNFGHKTDGADGIALLRKLRILVPDTPVILITAWGSIPLAVEGIKFGAADFITKPFNNRVLLQRVQTAIDMASDAVDDIDSGNFDRSGIIGRSRALSDILDRVRRIAPTDASVLITGENGTGKELIARAIHSNSRRRANPFVMVNLGGIPEPLFESEMFGHTRGAFTGAVGERHGRFETADKGTIFLDEIGELSAGCQVKLLRVLQEHTFERLGESRPRQVDIRVVSATNADLDAMLRNHTFREDLFYRINTIVLRLPALRERREDIPLLVDHFASFHARDSRVPQFASDAIVYLTRLPYPGNIRQLKNIVDRAILTSAGPLVSLADVEQACEGMPGLTAENTTSTAGYTLEQLERTAILAALEKHGGKLSDAAVELGITRQSLYRRMEKYGIKQ